MPNPPIPTNETQSVFGVGHLRCYKSYLEERDLESIDIKVELPSIYYMDESDFEEALDNPRTS